MPRGKEPQRVLPSSLGDDTRGGLERMNRRGLWAAGVVLLLVGLVGVLAIETGYAKDETEAAKCSEATLKGTYPFAQNGVEIKGNSEQRPFALAGYDVFDGDGGVKGVASGNFNGEVFRKDPFTGTYTVKANCTGTVTFRGVGGATTHGDIFIAPDGSMFAFVGTDPESVGASIDEQVTAKRVGE
jgi:hypothetical protein